MRISLFLVLPFLFFCRAVCSGQDLREEVNVQGSEVKLGPKLQFNLPNGKVDVFFKQDVLNSTIDFKTYYDFFNNYIYSDLDIRYNIKKVFFGIDLSDRVDFEQVFNKRKTLQRAKYLKPYVGYKLAEHLYAVAGTKFQNTYTITIDSQAVLDSGQNTVPSVGLHYEDFKSVYELTVGDKIFLDFYKSYAPFGSQYDYTTAELTVVNMSLIYADHILETELFMGYPVSVIKKPITEYYYLGGDERLKGYDYRELSGDSMIYLGWKYRIPLLRETSYRKAVFKIFSLELMAEAGKTGSSKIFEDPGDLSSSFGAGISYDLSMFNRLEAKMTLSVNQAVYSKDPMYYFTISALTYTQPN